jgi:PTS system galactitol-specific IIA component
VKIKDYLSQETVLIGLEAGSSEEVIRILGEKLQDLGYVKNDFIQAALERERSMPTGLPLGGIYNAAIPHVDIEYVHKSALGLATLKEPVLFYNMCENEKEVPCQLVIMLALDKPKSQIEMLQSVAVFLQSPDLIQEIMNAESADELLDMLP